MHYFVHLVSKIKFSFRFFFFQEKWKIKLENGRLTHEKLQRQAELMSVRSELHFLFISFSFNLKFKENNNCFIQIIQ